MTTNPLAGPSALSDIVHPQFHQNNFPEELYIKNELGLKLDKGSFLSFQTDSVLLTDMS
jgi:cleavage and polyadenylation specificity factor subunit 4